jgi:hypothetical protein
VAYGISIGGDALTKLARMDLQQQPHALLSMGSLFMTQLWMNPNKKELKISFSLFRGLL